MDVPARMIEGINPPNLPGNLYRDTGGPLGVLFMSQSVPNLRLFGMTVSTAILAAGVATVPSTANAIAAWVVRTANGGTVGLGGLVVTHVGNNFVVTSYDNAGAVEALDTSTVQLFVMLG